MKWLKRLEYMYASAGRLLDFSGSYSRIRLERRLAVPGPLRDRQMLAADRNALQRDINSAAKRLRRAYAR